MEGRIKALERTVGQMCYITLALMLVVIVDTAGLLILWGERGKPDFDHIAVSLTVFQTLFGIAALYGFWALRGLTREKAEEVAEKEVREIAPSLIRRLYQENIGTFQSEAPISNTDVDDIVEAISGDGKEGDDGQ
jgi:hypothetical protein